MGSNRTKTDPPPFEDYREYLEELDFTPESWAEFWKDLWAAEKKQWIEDLKRER